MSCCLACHFRDEERDALPYLPEREALRMLHEHAQLESMPKGPELRAALVQHAAREEALFSCVLPQGLAARYTVEHLAMLPELASVLVGPPWGLWGPAWRHGAAFGFCC